MYKNKIIKLVDKISIGDYWIERWGVFISAVLVGIVFGGIHPL